MKLEKILANRRWLRGSDPFPYYVATDVFVPEVYAEMEREFREHLSLGISERPTRRHVFSRNMGNYDAYALAFWPGYSGAFDVFLSREWRDVMGGLFDVEVSDDLSGSLHHHQAGSGNGFIHHDLATAWFTNDPRPDGINVSDVEACDYQGGVPEGSDAVSRQVVRAVAMIYYVATPPYEPGQGGDTGLYRSCDQAGDRPAVAVPPVNNSMVVFECTPYSLHSFMTSPQLSRNSVHVWAHQSLESAAERWGDERIVRW